MNEYVSKQALKREKKVWGILILKRSEMIPSDFSWSIISRVPTADTYVLHAVDTCLKKAEHNNMCDYGVL